MVRIVIILRPHLGKKATALQELAQPYPLTYFHIFKLKKKDQIQDSYSRQECDF